ncbi:MAG: type II toxin-antitoxin system RelE/ParE family toxin [Rhodospirillales bacterium]|nr:type II toxin-antitoxin system RelE/ParE family toxin [Rhodospirillales bacterium]
MIKGFANASTQRLFDTGKSKFPGGLDAKRAVVLLNMLNAAPSLETISPFRSMGLHALKGNRKVQWAITVNGPWRICFRYVEGHAYDVEIVDYH